MPILLWTVFYFLPAALAMYFSERTSILTHRIYLKLAAVLVSAGLMTLIGARLLWHIDTISLWVFGVSVILSCFLLKRFGPLYVLSAMLQQYCILLAATILMPVTGLFIAASATGLIYALVHRVSFKAPEPRWKLPILIGWGTVAIMLYTALASPVIPTALHIVGGTLLIWRGFLFPYRLPGSPQTPSK